MPFDPLEIAQFAVLRIPYKFDGDPVEISKLFVVLGHQAGHAICIKATHQVQRFVSNPDALAGCVHFAANSVACFPMETVVEPDNQFPISHQHIRKAEAQGRLLVHEPLVDFGAKVTAAIEQSKTLNKREKQRILAMLGPSSK